MITKKIGLTLVVLITICQYSNAQRTIDTIAVNLFYSLSFKQFVNEFGERIIENSMGWTSDDTLSKNKKHIGMDSLYVFNGEVVITSIFLYYRNDTLKKVTFYMDKANYSKFKKLTKKGCWLKLKTENKFSRFEFSQTQLYYRSSSAPGRTINDVYYRLELYDEFGYKELSGGATE